MGTKSLIGAGVAVILGTIIFSSYGKERVQSVITPWETTKKMLTDPGEVERRRVFAAFHAADTGETGQLDLEGFIGAFKALGYIVGGGPNIPDDAIVVPSASKTRTDRVIGDLFHGGDSDEDGLINIEEFLSVAEEIEPEG